MVKTSIAVCGKFHFLNYVPYLYETGCLDRIYFSHKWSWNSDKLKIPIKNCFNLWVKEYLLRLYGKCFGTWLNDVSYPFFHSVWDNQLSKRLKQCDIFHALVMGTMPASIERAKQLGALILGEPVNSHPEFLEPLLNDEYHRLGIDRTWKFPKATIKWKKELELCDHLLVGSQFLKESYLKSGFPLRKIHVIPYGVELARFSPVAQGTITRKKVFRVICVGQICPRKGQYYLLKAWEKLKLPNSELILIGSLDPDFAPVLNKFQGSFTHFSYVNHDQMRDYYQNSDVFVLPSIEDGFGLVITEAMACKLPVITTRNAGAAQIITNEIDGYILEIRDIDGLCQRLALLHNNPNLREEMGQRASQKAGKQLSWQIYSKSLLNLYQQIAKNPSDSSRN